MILDRNIFISHEKQENLPPNVKNKIFCVLISMLETNIKRIIKLIDLLVKEGFSGHLNARSVDRPLNPDQEHSYDVVVPCGGIIQNLFRENFRDEQQYLVNEFVLAVFESDENVAISYIQIATIISFYLSLICSQSASKQNIRNRYIFNRIWVAF